MLTSIFNKFAGPSRHCSKVLMADIQYWSQNVLQYQWLEDCLRLGEKISEASYNLKFDSGGQDRPGKTSKNFPQPSKSSNSCDDEAPPHKKMKSFLGKNINEESREDKINSSACETPDTIQGLEKPAHTPSTENSVADTLELPNKAVRFCNHKFD